MAFWDKFKKKSPTAPNIGGDRRQKIGDRRQETGDGRGRKGADETRVVHKLADKTVSAGKAKKETTGEAYRILLAPLVTEKGTLLESQNQYVFRVFKTANKFAVCRAIEMVYGVKPLRVRIINARGRRVRYGRIAGRTSAWKKAIVTLKKGEKIQLFEGV